MATASASAASCGEGTAGQPENQLHHLLHLVLVGAAVSHDGAFDLGGGVLDHRKPGLDRREHRHAARVSELQRAAHVGRVENVLDGDAVRARHSAISGGEPA